MALTTLGRAVVDGKVTLALNAKTEYDRTFAVGLGRELVLAWRDAPTPEARDSIERVMCNVGVERDDNGFWGLHVRGEKWPIPLSSVRDEPCT